MLSIFGISVTGVLLNMFEPLHRYAKSGNYNVRLNVYSEYGCTDSLIVFNAFSGSEFFIDFPNAFIPNPWSFGRFLFLKE